jgi:hypothetical protein
LLYPRWDNYLEFSQVSNFEHKLTFFILKSFVFEESHFLHNIRVHHSLSLFELLSYKYNCSFGLEDKIDNLLALTKDMVFKKKPLDKRGKSNLERKIEKLML